ncbi:MAG: ATP-binding protein, partial [Myxococcales bacterium]
YRNLALHLGLEIFTEFRVIEGGKALRLNAHAGLAPAGIARYSRLELGDGLSGRVALERQRLVVEGIHRTADPRLDVVRSVGLASAACFPLMAQDRLLGTLLFGTGKERSFTADEVSLMQLFADQVGVYLERNQLIEELRDADRRKNDFLAMLAHELRNPLAPVNNALEIFRAFADQHEVLRRAIASADRQVNHMTRLVDDLLDVSRITRGKVELRRATIELSSLVEQAVQSSEPAIRQRRHELRVSCPATPVRLFVDPTRLAQVLGNLLHNAAKYTDPGGQIFLSAECDGDELRFRVRDTGIGLSPEMLPRVFEAFVQVDPGSDRAQGGLGLGLTLVRSLVEMHGGTIEAFSAGRGTGSEFVVRLPLEKVLAPADQAPAEVAPDEDAPLPALSILLIEDNDDIRSTLRDLLELRGHTVDEAGDGASGVQALLDRRPALALVDIGL